ncbi:MAG: 16S rRNA (cytosine(967)-C(5))-methyltransferase RsmB [Clostridia bacterium]
MDKNISPREAALKILYEITHNNAYGNIALKKYLANSDYKVVDRGLITELVYGIIKYKMTIDYIVEQFSSIKMTKISPWILNVLRVGIYQIIYLDKIPDSAACNESVRLAKRYGHHASVNYVNAVLRNVSRNKEKIKYPDRNREPEKYLEVIYSYPDWLIHRWVKSFGFEFTEDLCKAGNEIPELSIRINTLKTNTEDLMELLSNEKVVALKGKYNECALVLEQVGRIDKLKAFQDGLFQVQDESSMLVSRILDPKPKEFIIDVCCAPGGKTTHIAQLMNNEGKVLGWDLHPHKIELVKSAAKRLDLDSIKAECHDATIEVNDLLHKADRVLVDAPCSGLGIIRRKPDIKWNKASADFEDIVHLQKNILQVCSQYVKNGGYLVYSTCTIQEEENIQVIDDFLDNNKEFQRESIEEYLPIGLKKETASNGYIQLYPNVDGIDGFFICKLRRQG